MQAYVHLHTPWPESSSETQVVQTLPSSSFSSVLPLMTHWLLSLHLWLHLSLWSILLSLLWKRVPVCGFASNFSPPNDHLEISVYSVSIQLLLSHLVSDICYHPGTFLSFRSKTQVSHMRTPKNHKVLWEETNTGKWLFKNNWKFKAELFGKHNYEVLNKENYLLLSSFEITQRINKNQHHNTDVAKGIMNTYVHKWQMICQVNLRTREDSGGNFGQMKQRE